jgi:hypothetical protein
MSGSQNYLRLVDRPVRHSVHVCNRSDLYPYRISHRGLTAISQDVSTKARESLSLDLACSKLHSKPESSLHIRVRVRFVAQETEQHPGDERVTSPYRTTGQVC